MSMPQQYDALSTAYDATKATDDGLVEQATVAHHVGPVAGKRVLELACGAGFYSRQMAGRGGAARVVGVDISEGMVAAARKLAPTVAAANPGAAGSMRFLAADCSQPLDLSRRQGGDGDEADDKDVEGDVEGSFDLVFAAWLLNYAWDEASMRRMWRNVARYLRPGGRFLGIAPCRDDYEFPRWHYGLASRVVEVLPGGVGVRVQLEFDVDPPVSFRCYNLRRDIYERAAAAEGMADFTWFPPVLPDTVSTDEQRAYWQGYLDDPTMGAISAIKK